MTRTPALLRPFALAGLAVLLTAAIVSAQAQAPNYGTSTLTYEEVPGIAFNPIESGLTYSFSAIISGQGLLTSPSGAYFAAPFRLPSGALLKFLELDSCDNTGSTGYVQGSLIESDKFGNILAFAPFMHSTGTGCVEVSEDISGLGMVGDNQNKHYWLMAYLADADGFTVGLAGMVVGYQLQVSPPPATATFGDVSTSHPFFQFIEALAASGITGGCGGGNYCPDNPVTRGQMAVFLAKALGLQFQ
jgi:S-layer homology domain